MGCLHVPFCKLTFLYNTIIMITQNTDLLAPPYLFSAQLWYEEHAALLPSRETQALYQLSQFCRHAYHPAMSTASVDPVHA